MTKYIHLTMEDGTEWDVPLFIIAVHRAEYYAYKENSNTTCKEEINFVFDNPDEAIDWLQNSMEWKDIVKHATKVNKPRTPDYASMFINAETSIIEK